MVIANPPYVVMPSNNPYSTYKTFSSLELYAYFFEKGITLLTKNGVISYITASLYLKGMKFVNLRTFIETHTKPICLKLVGDDVFENVKMPTAVFIAVNDANVNKEWSFSDFNEEFKLLSKITDNTVFVKDISTIMRGMEIGKDMVFENGDIPFITGSNIQKYHIRTIGYITELTLKAFGKNPYYFSGERILIRETGSKLTSIYIDFELNSNRSLYSIKLKDSSFDYKFILACLNSKVLQFYYQTKFKSETNLFPKIRIGQVKELPIPNADKNIQQQISGLIDEILSSKKSDTNTSELEVQIDILVFKLYNLTYDEVKVIDPEFQLSEAEYDAFK